MLEKVLFENYRLSSNQFINYMGYKAFRNKNDIYVIVPTHHFEPEEILEMKQMCDYLQFQKQVGIASFVPTINEELVAVSNEERISLLKIPQSTIKLYYKEGEELAKFHQKGRYYPYPPKKATRIGQWKTLWENRLDQLENWWGKKIQELPTNKFEKSFYGTFPYYLGVTENAIQYIADCTWEDQRNETEMGAICHTKYKSLTENNNAIFPTQFVYDHPTRDIAEWIRHKFLEGSSFNDIIKFLNDYERVMPLSAMSWRMLYGRLLFPLSYFELIEGYYSTEREEIKEQFAERFFKYLEQTEQYERFLGNFYRNIGLPVRNLQIPEIEWLHRV